MITPFLENQILCGNAVFKTFTAGGSYKSVLNVSEGCFIIITDLTYFPRVPPTMDLSDYQKFALTQLLIASSSRNDNFLFRNSVSSHYTANLTRVQVLPGETTKIDCYLLHSSDVIFAFTDCADVTLTSPALTPAKGSGLHPPLEYGKQSLPGSLAVPLGGTFTALSQAWAINFAGVGVDITGLPNVRRFNGLRFPSQGMAGNVGLQYTTPLCHINYVEIKGTPATAVANNN